jgi:hypothetical protein
VRFLRDLTGLPVPAAVDHIGYGMRALFTSGLPRPGIDAWDDIFAGHAARYNVTTPGVLLT